MKVLPTVLLALTAACGSPDRRCERSGEQCESDLDCDGCLCVADLERAGADLESLPLLCSEKPVGSGPGQGCDRAEECERGICLLTGACAVPCFEDSHCRDEEHCALAYARTSDSALQPLKACLSLADLPPGGAMQSEVFEGLLPEAEEVTVELPAVTPTSIFVLEHLASEAWPAFKRCRSPICVNLLQTREAAPAVLFDARLYAQPWQGQEEAPLNPIAVGSALIAYESHPTTVMLPNGPRSVLSESGFEIALESELAGDLRLTRLHNQSPGALLDLNIFYAGGLDWAPAGDRGPPLLEEALSSFEQIFEPVGIGLGQIRQFEVVGGLRERLQAVTERYGVLEALPELFSLSAGVGNPGVNLFFVKQIAETLAISGGTPGALGMQGTGASGIAFSTDLIDDGEQLGKIIAHEIGHHLGLFHTSEMEGVVLDPLPDTPECRIEHDQDGDGIVSVLECSGLGEDNLMFWALGGGTRITPEQVEVLRSAPILQ